MIPRTESLAIVVPHAQLFDACGASWPDICLRVLELDATCYLPGDQYEDGLLENWFKDTDNVVVLLKKFDNIIGYGVTRPVSNIWHHRAHETTTYNLSTIVIDPAYQRKGYVGTLLDAIACELKKRGVVRLEMNANFGNGFASSIGKNYRDQIVSQGSPRTTRFGFQQFFKIQI